MTRIAKSSFFYCLAQHKQAKIYRDRWESGVDQRSVATVSEVRNKSRRVTPDTNRK